MKKLFLLATLSAFVMTTGCDDSAAKKVNQDNVQATDNGASQSADAPVMTFDKVAHDFGTISEGERVQTTFTFTNTGKSDLIIVDARGAVDVQCLVIPKIRQSLPEVLVRFW